MTDPLFIQEMVHYLKKVLNQLQGTEWLSDWSYTTFPNMTMRMVLHQCIQPRAAFVTLNLEGKLTWRVTTAFGFFSTAYTFSLRPVSSAAYRWLELGAKHGKEKPQNENAEDIREPAVMPWQGVHVLLQQPSVPWHN